MSSSSPAVARLSGSPTVKVTRHQGNLIPTQQLAEAQIVVYNLDERSLQVFADLTQTWPIDVGPYDPRDKLTTVGQEAFQFILITLEILSGFEFILISGHHQQPGKHVYKRTDRPFKAKHSY